MKRFLLAAIVFCFSAAAHAQSFPNKPVKLLVGFAAGGPTDVIARILAQDMTGTLGQTVLVENKAGATSMIATQEVKRAPADGYTLYMTTLTHSVNAVLHADKKPYDPIADFTPVSLVCHLPLVMVTKGDSSFNNAADVVKAAKEKPGEISYGSSGNGGSAHLAGALVEALTGTRMLHVPFKGNAPALTELLAGRIDMVIDQPASSEAFVKAGKLKPLAVTSLKRIPTAPDVPTLNESGFPGFEAIAWFGLGFPAGTPPEIVARMNTEVAKALADPELKQKLEAAGITPLSMSSGDFTNVMKADVARWAKVISDAKVTTE